MVSDTIKGLYQQLINLHKQFRETPLSSAHIKDVLQYSESLLQAVHKHPDAIPAQLQLYKPQLPYLINLNLNRCLLTALLCIRNHINESCARQLICAALSVGLFEQQTITAVDNNTFNKKHLSANKAFLHALEKAKLDVWFAGYQLTESLPINPAARQHYPAGANKLQAIVIFAHYLSGLITPRRARQAVLFGRALKMCVQSSPSSWLDVISPLLIYPSIFPPGAFVRTHKGKTKFILSVSLLSAGKLQVCDITTNGLHPVKQLDSEDVVALYPAQALKRFQQCDKWWGKAYTEAQAEQSRQHPLHDQTYRLDQPPPVLLSVQQQLAAQDIDLRAIAELIKEEPALAKHIERTASLSNRQKLPVSDVKHGLMTHGYDRANSLLIQQALMQRLNQHYYPLQEQLIQFTQLRAIIAGKLFGNNRLLGEQASTLACFANTGLFTIGEIKHRLAWQTIAASTYDICQLFYCQQRKALYENPLHLAQAWQQRSTHLAALKQCRKMPEDVSGSFEVKMLTLSMGLSLILARQCYFATSITCKQTLQYQQQAADSLKLAEAELQQITLSAMCESHVHCALGNKIRA